MIDPSQNLLVILTRDSQYQFVQFYRTSKKDSHIHMILRFFAHFLTLDKGSRHPHAPREMVPIQSLHSDGVQLYILADSISLYFPGHELLIVDWTSGRTKLVRLRTPVILWLLTRSAL
jgi:hypothetical protein